MPSSRIGMILAASGIRHPASGIGGAVGSYVASRVPVTARRGWVTAQLCAWWVAFGILALVGEFSVTWAALVMAVIGLTGALSNIEITTYQMENVDDAILARVNSISRVVSLTGAALGSAIGGVLDERYGLKNSVFCLFALITVLAVVSALAPSMRERMVVARLPASAAELEAPVAAVLN